MKKLLIIAGNWKSNKTIAEAKEWIQKFKSQISNLNDQLTQMTLVLCAPFTLLSVLKEEIKTQSLPLLLAAQDVSPFPDGAYTGAVSARQVKELADWAIIGHSERRKHFGETDEVLSQKVGQAKHAGLKIIFCVPDEQTAIPADVDVVAYEPVWAIGTGKSDSPENANSVITAIKQKTGMSRIIYGGSVMPENVASFVGKPSIDGVLPGSASLDPEKFANIVSAAVAGS